MTSDRTLQRVRDALDAQRALLGEPSGMPAVVSAPTDVSELRAACAQAVLTGLDRGLGLAPEAVREAVRHLLGRLAAEVPGNAVEVRVPPYAAVQCVPGARHTRGTPPNIVETDPRTWLDVATGRVSWYDAVANGRVHASGERSDLSAYLPLTNPRADQDSFLR